MNTNSDSLFNSGRNMPISSHVRFLNIVNGLQPVDLYADGDLIAENIGYGEFTDYTSVPPGVYNVELYKTGETEKPIEQDTESFTAGGSATLTATGTPDNINLYQIPEPYTSPAAGLRSYVRMVNMSENAPPLGAVLENGTRLFNDVRFTELTNYYKLVPNIYNVDIISSTNGEKLLSLPRLQLQAGEIYTIYIADNKNSVPPYTALFVSDSEYPPHYRQ